MELILENCAPYSPHIEAKCLARNEQKAMEVLKQALDELKKAEHQMRDKEYNELFSKYTEAYNTIEGKHVSEDKAENNHLQHDVYKTAEGLYVTAEQAPFYNAFKVHEGIYLKQNKVTFDTRDLIYEGDYAIIAAIKISRDANLAALEQENEAYAQELNEDKQGSLKQGPYESLTGKLTEGGVEGEVEVEVTAPGSHYVSEFSQS